MKNLKNNLVPRQSIILMEVLMQKPYSPIFYTPPRQAIRDLDNIELFSHKQDSVITMYLLATQPLIKKKRGICIE